MRASSCLACRFALCGQWLANAVSLAELVGPDTHHHHHIIDCEGCGLSWYDDIVISASGLPVVSRRDTLLCDCPDQAEQYTRRVLVVPWSEAGCRCNADYLERAGVVL